MFQLHDRLQSDTAPIGRLSLCHVLLSNDANYPWVLLVPEREDVTEIHQLAEADRAQLMVESCAIAEALETGLRPDKMNVASLGNVVPQLHVHHIARFKGDAAWPGPVWGAKPPRDYAPGGQAGAIGKLRELFGKIPGFSAE